MGGLTLSPPPGAYNGSSLVISVAKDDPTINLVLQSQTVKPALAKYIAYDTFGNPFIAVLSDGGGNVVFDGGFPKFYNSAWVAGATYATLDNRFKYMVNALNWCADPEKTDKKVLLLGDKSASPYAIGLTGTNDFKTSFDGMCAIGGFTPTYLMGDPLPALSYSYLSQFACVVVMSSRFNVASDALPGSLVANLLALREAGSGIIIVTDHNAGGINENVATFQRTANQLATQFGAKFYGNVDRVPVSIDFLIANYGMHPLWENMTGSFFAGGSEGIIQITTFPEFQPGVDTITLSGSGYKTIHFLVQREDGTTETMSFSYALNIADPVSPLTFDPTVKAQIGFPAFSVADMNGQKPSGLMLLNGQVVGTFDMALGQPLQWTVPNLALNKGANSFEVRVTFPVTYSSNYSIQRVTYPKTASGNLARHAIQMKGAELGGTADLSFARTHRKLQNLAGLPNEVSGAEALANVKQHLMAD